MIVYCYDAIRTIAYAYDVQSFATSARRSRAPFPTRPERSSQ